MRPLQQFKKDRKKQKQIFLNKKINEIRKTGSFRINYYGLQKIPPKIYGFENLVILDFGFNNIQIISPQINQLQNLEKLYMNNNPL
jgi:Leucine-rich repeat (LRR) protein